MARFPAIEPPIPMTAPTVKYMRPTLPVSDMAERPSSPRNCPESTVSIMPETLVASMLSTLAARYFP